MLAHRAEGWVWSDDEIRASTESAKPGALANISWLAAGQLEKLADALTVTRYEKRSTIFSDKSPSESAYILLSGVARITCDNRKGRRTLVIMVSPGLIPEFPARRSRHYL